MAFLSRESILWWVLTTFNRRRKRYRSLFDTRTSSLAYVEFRNPTEAENFLTKLEETAQRANAFTRALCDAELQP
jgi:anion-transporting  ArsA/GET3 family ATPase